VPRNLLRPHPNSSPFTTDRKLRPELVSPAYAPDLRVTSLDAAETLCRQAVQAPPACAFR